MKTIILLVSFLFFIGISSLCSLFAKIPNEDDAATSICAITRTDCDYVLSIKDDLKAYRIGEKREAFIGTYEDGLYFDGEHAYRYTDQKQIPTEELPTNKCDSYAEEILGITQTIILNKLCIPYNDERTYYKESYYYFEISDEGLHLFQDDIYESGRIECLYRHSVFQTVRVSLYKRNSVKPDLECTFGAIDYTIGVMPVTTPITYHQ